MFGRLMPREGNFFELFNAHADVWFIVSGMAQVVLYDLRKYSAVATHLAELCEIWCEGVRSAVQLLTNLKQTDAILKTCQEIDRLESDADRVMRSAMSKLFRDEPDLKQLIKLRTIYELLELITDRCEDVANVIEGIVLENS